MPKPAKLSNAEVRADVRSSEALEALVADLRAELAQYRLADKLQEARDRIQAARALLQPLIGAGEPCSPLAEAVARALQGEE